MDIRSWFSKPKPQQPTEERSYNHFNNYLTFNGQSGYNASRSMNLSAAYRCVEVISDAVAQLPIECYKLDAEGFKRRYIESPIYKIITKSPNKMQTRFTFIKTLITSVLLKGNGYALIERDGKGSPISLRFILADYVVPQIDKLGNLCYQVSGYKQLINAKDMIHVLNFSYDGIVGVSTITHAKNTLGLATDSEAHASGFFKGGANLAGALKVEGSLTDAQKNKMATAWRSAFSPSSGDPNGVAILEGNMSFEPITVNPADAQLLETRKFNVIEICRFFGVSPIKVFDLDAANYSTVEATQLAFLTDTLAPLLEKLELEFNRKLFDLEEDATINFEESSLLRTDKAAQASYFNTLINAGIMTPAEARKQLDLPYREEADQLYMMTNMAPLSTINQINTEENAKENNGE